MESPLDPNYNGVMSNIPLGYEHGILDELKSTNMEEEKYYLWRDKTGRGEKPVKLSKSHIQSTWDLEETDYFDITLEDYLENSYIGDKWTTRTESLECIEIH